MLKVAPLQLLRSSSTTSRRRRRRSGTSTSAAIPLLLVATMTFANWVTAAARRTAAARSVSSSAALRRHAFASSSSPFGAGERRRTLPPPSSPASSSFPPSSPRTFCASTAPRRRPSSSTATTTTTATTRRFLSSADDDVADGDDDGFFSAGFPTFESLGCIRSKVLLDRLANSFLGGSVERPTSIQALAVRTIAENPRTDVVIGAETGSGKTLAYLLPIMDDVLTRKREAAAAAAAAAPKEEEEEGQKEDEKPSDIYLSYDYARAIVLVPNKELVQQVVRMAKALAGGDRAVVSGGGAIGGGTGADGSDDVSPSDIVRIAVLPGGLSQPLDFKPFRDTIGLSGGGTDPPVDLVVTTPAALSVWGTKPKFVDMFADVETLVVDEADMLLDGGYVRALENVLLGFRRADRLQVDGVAKTQHIFAAATLPDSGLRSVDAYLQKKFPYAIRATTSGMHSARHYGLAERTRWIMEETKKGRMEQLVELLQTSPADTEAGGLESEKVMVFLNSVDDVEGASQALNRAGVLALPYHAKLSLGERTTTLERFRKYDASAANSTDDDIDDDSVPVLVCTDLASRGLDVPGVSAIVQLQFAGNVVAHLHRMGRCGRAGSKTGRGIVFYSQQEEPLVEVVRKAEAEQERMALQQDVLEVEAKDDLRDGDGEDGEREDVDEVGKVKKAFSRKRGFTKRLKKLKREQRQR